MKIMRVGKTGCSTCLYLTVDLKQDWNINEGDYVEVVVDKDTQIVHMKRIDGIKNGINENSNQDKKINKKEIKIEKRWSY